MNLKKYFLIVMLVFFISACSKSVVVNDTKIELEKMSFDVVEKKLILSGNLPSNVQNLLKDWFNHKVKINGFEGTLTFSVLGYSEVISQINNGKRVDITLEFNAIIEKSSLTQKTFIKGVVTSFGSIDGNFSLKDFDTVIKNTQTDLISRLSKDLKSKI